MYDVGFCPTLDGDRMGVECRRHEQVRGGLDMPQLPRRLFEITDEEILHRLRSTEDDSVERKTFGDMSDVPKTIVAFANSCPFESYGILFIGATNSGHAQEMPQKQNLESLQESLRKYISRVFPPVEVRLKTVQDGVRECLAMLIQGSRKRPHFEGTAYIREGCSSRKASEREWAQLFAQRNEKAYRILQSKGETVRVERLRSERMDIMGDVLGYFEAAIEDCDELNVTLRTGAGESVHREDVPLDRIFVGKDYERGSRLKLQTKVP